MTDKEIEQKAEEYVRMNSLLSFVDPKIREAAKAAFMDGLYAAKGSGTFNPKYCYGYLKSGWEYQKEAIKEIFGNNDAYTIEQYVNGLLEIIKEFKKTDMQNSQNNKVATPPECPECGSSNTFDLGNKYECDDCQHTWIKTD